MGWNGSRLPSEAEDAPAKCGACMCSHGRMRGLIAGVVIVVGAAIAFVLINNQEAEKPKPVEKKNNIGAIAEVAPTVTNVAEMVVRENVPEPEDEFIEVDGKKIKLAADPKTGKPKYDKNVRIIPMRKSDIKPRRFEFDAEELIAATLEIEPGTPMYGEIPFGKRFKDSLMSSFMTPVEIKPTDDEYTVELKKQVQAVKDEFREILLNGGDPAEEMRKARAELIELGRYRTTMVQELNQLRKSGAYTSQDMKDFVSAANKIMEEKGLKPISMPAVLLRNMELNERKNQQ